MPLTNASGLSSLLAGAKACRARQGSRRATISRKSAACFVRLAMKRVPQEREARSAAGVRFDKTDERDVFEAQLLSVFCADEKLPSGRQLDRVAANNLWRDAKHCLMLLRQGRNPFGPGLKAHCAHCRCRGNAGGSGLTKHMFCPARKQYTTAAQQEAAHIFRRTLEDAWSDRHEHELTPVPVQATPTPLPSLARPIGAESRGTPPTAHLLRSPPRPASSFRSPRHPALRCSPSTSLTMPILLLFDLEAVATDLCH